MSSRGLYRSVTLGKLPRKSRLSISIHKFIEGVAASGTCASIAYYAICTASARRYRKDRGNAPTGSSVQPAISILKPLKGTDPEMYECLKSHFQQAYPDYEIVFGVSDGKDPAVAVVERMAHEFPERKIQLVVCEKKVGNNRKVGNLSQMVAHAANDILVVNDSDIRVAPDYLRRVAQPLAAENVGLVTCLYRGVPSQTLGSQLESLGIATDFIPGVLTARMLENGIHFGLGSTLAFRRSDLEAIGGFESIADHLADDYELGHRIAELGREVELSSAIVETFLPAYSVRDFIAHQLRWGRTIRESRPGGYFGLLFTFGLPWAALAVIASAGARWSWLLLGFAGAARIAMARAVGTKVLHDAAVGKNLWLLPVRDFLALAIWVASYAGRTIRWRDEVFRLKGGKLVR